MKIVIDKILPLFIIVAGNIIKRLELKFCDLTHLHPQCVVDELDHINYGVCLWCLWCMQAVFF